MENKKKTQATIQQITQHNASESSWFKDYIKVAANSFKVYRWWSPPSEGQVRKMVIQEYIRGFCWSCHDD